MTINEKALKLHEEWNGKLEIVAKSPVKSREDLSLAYTHMWTHSITGGRGWIAVALVIFAFWRPGRAVAGAYLFGGAAAFQMRLQASGTDIPSSFLAMFPYIMTLLVLLLSSTRGRNNASPAGLGVNLEPEE